MSAVVDAMWAIVGSAMAYILCTLLDLQNDIFLALVAIVVTLCIGDALDTIIEEQKERAREMHERLDDMASSDGGESDEE